MNVYVNCQGHMTKMVAMAINSKGYDFETWHEPSGGEALQSLYKSWPWDDLHLSYGQGQHRAPMHLNGEKCRNVI